MFGGSVVYFVVEFCPEVVTAMCFRLVVALVRLEAAA